MLEVMACLHRTMSVLVLMKGRQTGDDIPLSV